MLRQDYIAQVELLLDCLPVLKDQRYFAMKGGTAINFFIHELPRLSVDIDLTFIDLHLGRVEAINKIEEGLLFLAEGIKRRNRRYTIDEARTREGFLHKLIVVNGNTKIKIEPNFIMRGTLTALKASNICQSIEDRFAFRVNDIPLLSVEELYAGKICAALSRQHPRDFFDIKVLLEAGGLSREICSAFVVYLACSPRPMHELLDPHLVLNRSVYDNEFVNMTEEPVSFESLMDTRKTLIREVNQRLTNDERQFLVSLKSGEPDYSLLPYENVERLPALQWKLLNIKKMNKTKHSKMLDQLKKVLGF